MSFRLADGVTYAYPPAGPVVLRDLNLSLPDGKTTVVLGGSGVGKTTLLNLLALLWDRRLGRGSITYTSPRTGRQWDYDAMTPGERAWLRGHEFGLAPQSSHFLPGFTCCQNLTIPLALSGLGRRVARRGSANCSNWRPARIGSAGTCWGRCTSIPARCPRDRGNAWLPCER